MSADLEAARSTLSKEERDVHRLPVDGLTRFVDVWFDNIFTDFSVRGRIKDAQANVDGALRGVIDVSVRLRRRGADIKTRLGQIGTGPLAVLAG